MKTPTEFIPSEDQQLAHRKFFDACMQDAGYSDYQSLAEALDPCLDVSKRKLVTGEKLSIKEKLRIKKELKTLTSLVSGLASGDKLPLYFGVPRVEAMEIATLLNLDFDDLFAAMLPQPDGRLDNDDAYAEQPALTHSEILRLTQGIDAAAIDAFLQIEIMGRTIGDVAAERGLNAVPSVRRQIQKQYDAVKVLFERIGEDYRLMHIPTEDILTSSVPFNAASAVTDIIFESKRVLGICQADGVTAESQMKFRYHFERGLRQVENKLSRVTTGDYVLHQCQANEILGMLEIYADHKIDPSRDFLNACLAARDILCDGYTQHDNLARLHATVIKMSKSYSGQGQVGAEYSRINDDYQRLLAFK